MKNLFLFSSLLFLPLLAFGEPPVPEGDPLASLLNLVLNWKAAGPIAIASSLVVVLVQLLKNYAGAFEYKRTAVVALSCIYGVLQALVSGLGLVEAIVLALVTSGGAMALYESIKNPLLKQS